MATSTHVLAADPDAVSPGGGAQIRYILKSQQGDLTHAVCPAGTVAPTHHLPELDEAYFVLAGQGEIWRRAEGREAITALRPGRWVQMPAGTLFQYRAGREASLVFLVAVLPSWEPELFHTVDDGVWVPGSNDEAVPSEPSTLVDGWMSGDLHYGYDDLAPDGSDIRLLGAFDKGSLAHCTLNAGQRSTPMRHRTVHEIWYVQEGHGELWRASPDSGESVVPLLARRWS